jgi:3-methyladenine DNA glycosylase AlkD
MSAIESIYSEFKQYCEKNANEANRLKYQRYFVEGYDAYGLDQKSMEAERDRLWKLYGGSQINMGDAGQLAEMLWPTGKYELMSFAIWMMRYFVKEFTPETFEMIGKWYDRYVINWAHSDIMSGDFMPLFLTKDIIPLQVYGQWMLAESRWRRRGCVVGLIKPVQQGKVKVTEALEVIRPAMLDEEKVVHQGLGWFLREAWMIEPTPVEAFLMEYKDRCARLIIQYATEKMDATGKARFKKVKN